MRSAQRDERLDDNEIVVKFRFHNSKGGRSQGTRGSKYSSF